MMLGYKCNKSIRLLVLTAIFLVIPTLFSYADENTVKVGVYENEPLAFRDEDGTYRGLSIDVLEQVALKEGWRLEYVHGTLSECLKRIEKGETDIQVVIGYSKARAEKLDFTKVTLFSNWGQIYTRPGSEIESILDLEGRTVVLVKGTIYNRAFRELIGSLGITSEIIEADDYPSILTLLDEGKVDAGVLNRSFADMKARHYKARKTSIIFHPIETRYALPKGKNINLGIAIDKRLEAMLEDKNSVYHQSFNRYFGRPARWTMPGWVKWSIVAVTGLLVLSISLVALFRDKVRRRTMELTTEITERKRAEEELRRNREQLEDLVSERTVELTEANENLQLEITKRKKIEEEILKVQKLESIGILAGGIAHDFNNILTSILNNVYLLKTSLNIEDKSYRRLEAAEKGIRSAAALTKQLLTFSRGGDPVKESLSIGDLLRDATTFALRGSNVKCELDIPENLWSVEADSGLLSQAISNIVINSDQAMPDGGMIKGHAENTAVGEGDDLPLPEGRYVRLSLKDSGVGVAKEHIGRIFDPYFTTKQKGSGLGLASAYSIVKKHGGHVTVESEIGVGTTFHIYIPASLKEITPIIETEGFTPVASPANILLMEDEVLIAESTVMGLEGFGYKVKSSRDGAEAIEMYRNAMGTEAPFDLVILDLTIPGGMGGKETIDNLREMDPDVKAIVASGYSDDPIMSNFREYGFMGVIKKPYEIEEMVATLNNFSSDDPQRDAV
jgi:signal transduction histidine kinase/ABC-type amino acid transport substrate-binding protein/ActR/RegA family two-component response regulator